MRAGETKVGRPSFPYLQCWSLAAADVPSTSAILRGLMSGRPDLPLNFTGRGRVKVLQFDNPYIGYFEHVIRCPHRREEVVLEKPT